MSDINKVLEEAGITSDEFKKFLEDKETFKVLDKSIKSTSGKIKEAFIKNNLDKATFEQSTIKLSYMNKSTTDEDKLVDLLLKKGFNDAVFSITKPDIEKVKELVTNGAITDEEFLQCTTITKVPVIKFTTKKKKADDKIKKAVDSYVKSNNKMF